MQRLLYVHILSEQSGKLSAGDLSGVVVSRTRMFTTCPFCHKLGSKGMIQLSTSHALFVLRHTHLDEFVWIARIVLLTQSSRNMAGHKELQAAWRASQVSGWADDLIRWRQPPFLENNS